MSGTAHFRPSAYSRVAVARLGPALAASALVHLALLSAPPPDTPWRGVASYPGDAPITVRLAPAPVPVPDVPASPEPEARPMPRQPGPLVGSAEGVRSESSPSVAAHTGIEVLALPQAADPSYYTARDLDSYPSPVVALDINRLVNRAVGIPSTAIRLELIIDEHGIVNHVAFAAPGITGVLETELRAVIAATRFVPARKDGRAVKSRVLMIINFEIGAR